MRPAPSFSNNGASPGFLGSLASSIVNTGPSLLAHYSWSNNVLIGGFTGSSLATAKDMSYAQVMAYAANMPPGDIYPPGNTIAARQASAGLDTKTWRSSVYNSRGIGANIDTLISAMGIVSGVQAPTLTPFSGTFFYEAPDSRACAVDVSADGSTWFRKVDSGGARKRSREVQGLRPGTTYQWRILCYYTQQNDGVLYTDYTPDEITTGSFTTPARPTVAR